MCERAALLVRSDLRGAEALAREARALGESTGEARAKGLAARCEGIVRWAGNQYEEAMSAFGEAIARFQECGEEVEEARTRSNAIQTLIYLSRYEEAFDWAGRAREVFLRHGEPLRLARLEGNLANLLYRQDRFEEAIGLYENVERIFRTKGEARDVAAVLRNKAVCQLSLSRFEEALETHREARTFCLEHGMTHLAGEADYNIAYLYFLRGDYLRALELYEVARGEARAAGDGYHLALCDLDQAEMFIELNLTGEGETLARRAAVGFRKLGMGYEAAKAQVFMALCAGRRGNARRALAILARARRRFVGENNAVWPALIDLYAGVLLSTLGRARAARLRARRALGFFSPTVLPGKAIQCRLLLARLDLERGKTAAAAAHAAAAERLLPRAQSPALAGHTAYVAGRIREATGDEAGASALYEQAQGEFEAMQDRLRGEDLRISFFQDKTAAHEANFQLLLRQGKVGAAFHAAERAKSRNLTGQANPKPNRGTSAGARARLGGLYRRLEEIETKGAGTREGEAIRAELQALEASLKAAVKGADGGAASRPTLEQVREALGQEARLVEYFGAGERIYAFVIGRERSSVHALGLSAQIGQLLRYTQFQLSIGRRADAGGRLEHVQAHLRALYEELIAPLERELDGEHCVFVPHGILHGLPFHALFDGKRYLGERYTISTAPSAAALLRSEQAGGGGRGRPLVFGVADEAAPAIRDEAEMVAGLLPGAELYLNEAATVERFRRLGERARHVHLATHGRFRRDNPWFSSLRMGDGMLSLYDLYDMRLGADLVVLSGCSTGLSVVLGGDELVGLVRGILHAGARSALLSLWDVSDDAAVVFMRHFYRELGGRGRLAGAVQTAQAETRREYPHPYYWAPFTLVGRYGEVA